MLSFSDKIIDSVPNDTKPSQISPRESVSDSFNWPRCQLIREPCHAGRSPWHFVTSHFLDSLQIANSWSSKRLWSTERRIWSFPFPHLRKAPTNHLSQLSRSSLLFYCCLSLCSLQWGRCQTAAVGVYCYLYCAVDDFSQTSTIESVIVGSQRSYCWVG